MKFTPVVRLSHSIPKSLIEFSKERSIELQALDFELLSFETLIKRAEMDNYETLANAQELTSDDMHNEQTSIIQEYSIKILPKRTTPLLPKIKMTLALNKHKTKAQLTILKGSIFEEKINTLQQLKQRIWEQKLKAGIFIDIFEPKLNTQLQKLLSVVPKNKPLNKDVKFTVALGVEPVAAIDAHLEKIYALKKHDNNIIDGVDEKELIARYIKKRQGCNGRACNGRYIRVRDPRVVDAKPQTHSSIEVKETNNAIEYFAKENGYVVFENNTLRISNQLTLEGASFKSSATIDAGDKQRDISVHIAHKKTHAEDAISSGVNIDVQELNVDGSVGANVNIAAQNLNVDAQTHKKAKMEVSDSANVKLHRGDLVAKDASVDILETGKITAHNSIKIKKMVGGEAIAPVVEVEELLSNSTIIASERIEIRTILGENNTLIINPDAIESYHKEIEELKDKIKTLTKELHEKQQDFQERFTQHAAQAKRIKTFQARAAQATKAGKTPMKQDLIRIRLYKKDSQAFALEKKALEEQLHTLQKYQAQLEHYYTKELHAKIIVHTPYDGHTKVVFVNLKTKEEIDYRPEGKIDTISLTLNEKGEKVIKLD